MLTQKLDVASILYWNFIIQKIEYSERVERSQIIAVNSEYLRFCLIKFQHRMDATPSFGVTIISEVPSKL